MGRFSQTRQVDAQARGWAESEYVKFVLLELSNEFPLREPPGMDLWLPGATAQNRLRNLCNEDVTTATLGCSNLMATVEVPWTIHSHPGERLMRFVSLAAVLAPVRFQLTASFLQ